MHGHLLGAAATHTPFAGVRVTAESGGLVWSATSGDDGRYRIDVPAGTYHLTADAPPGYTASFAPANNNLLVSAVPNTVTLPNTRACTSIGWWVTSD